MDYGCKPCKRLEAGIGYDQNFSGCPLNCSTIRALKGLKPFPDYDTGKSLSDLHDIYDDTMSGFLS